MIFSSYHNAYSSLGQTQLRLFYWAIRLSARASKQRFDVLTALIEASQCLIGHDAACRLVERFLLDNYKPHQLSTYALTLYRHDFKGEDGKVTPVGE